MKPVLFCSENCSMDVICLCLKILLSFDLVTSDLPGAQHTNRLGHLLFLNNSGVNWGLGFIPKYCTSAIRQEEARECLLGEGL